MFDLVLSDEEELIRGTARRFAVGELADAVSDHEAAGAVPPDVVARFAATGLGTRDGEGMSALGRVLMLEELAAVDPGAAIALDGLGLAGYVLAAFDLEIPATGRGAVVFDPDGRVDLAGANVSAAFPWVPASQLDVLVIVQPPRAAVVTEGIELSPVGVSGCRAAGASAVRLRDAPAVVVGDAVRLEQAVARMRAATAALLVGAARGAYDYARAYATERTAFGKPIAHHQALGFLIVEMAMAIDSARLGLWNAAHCHDAGRDARFAAAGALAHAAEAALFVGPNAVQVLGAHGFIRDFPVEKFMRDIRTLPQLVGGHDEAILDAGALADRIEVGLR